MLQTAEVLPIVNVTQPPRFEQWALTIAAATTLPAKHHQFPQYPPQRMHTPDQFPVVVEWPIHWGDQDLFGHVNNVIYFRWLESARVAYLDRIGLARLHGKEDVGPILAAISCNFRRQIQYPNVVRVGTKVTRIGRTSMTIEHGIWAQSEGDELAADGSSTVVTFDYRTQRPTAVPDEIRRKIEQIEGRSF